MVGDRLLAGRRRQPPVADQLGEQLGVVDDLVAAAEVGVLVRDRVEAVRAARDDLRHAGLVQRLHVLLGVGLEDELVAHPARGVAGARLARAEDREVDARGGRAASPSSARPRARARRTTRRSRPSTGISGTGSPGSSTRTSSPSVQAARSACGLPHGFALALDVAQHRLGLAREARLDHHQVAPQVDDVVDVLDVDRARLHAGAARHAVPRHLLELRRRRDRRAFVVARERLRPLREQVVAHAHDHELGRQRLAGEVGRAGVLAAPALGARERVHHLLPRQVLDGPDAEAHLLLGQLLVEAAAARAGRASACARSRR